jgi:hypothetical protein
MTASEEGSVEVEKDPVGPPRRSRSRRARISPEQARFLARLIRELAAVWRPGGDPLHDEPPPEYTRFIEGAYACGFVDPDTIPHWEDLRRYTADPEGLRQISFDGLRAFVYMVIRNERATGGGIAEALDSGALGIVAERLAALEEAGELE